MKRSLPLLVVILLATICWAGLAYYEAQVTAQGIASYTAPPSYTLSRSDLASLELQMNFGSLLRPGALYAFPQARQETFASPVIPIPRSLTGSYIWPHQAKPEDRGTQGTVQPIPLHFKFVPESADRKPAEKRE